MRVTALTGPALATAFALALAAAGVTTPAAAQPKPADPVATRLATQNALFEEYWQTELKLSPTMATAVGDYPYNDKLGDNSLAALAHPHEVNAAFLARIKAISPHRFGEEQRTS